MWSAIGTRQPGICYTGPMQALFDPARPSLILWPLLGHVALVVFLYGWLTVARTRAVRAGEVAYGCFEFGRDEPPSIARVTRNLANQFELPVLLYVSIMLLLHFAATRMVDVALAWVFLAGRVVHTVVQTRTDNVPLRGKVFMINFLGVAGLWFHVALIAWFG
jgi:hypothetical protein